VGGGGVEQAMQAMEALQIGAGGSNGGGAYSPPPTSAATSAAYNMGAAGNGLGLGGGLGLSMPAANGAGGIDALVGGAAVGGAVGEQSGAVLVNEWPGSTSDLQQMFSRFGTITFCDADATSGSARVVFDSTLAASHAVEMMNGYAIGEKKLLVSLTAGY